MFVFSLSSSFCCVLPTTLMQSAGSAPRCKTCLPLTQQSRNLAVQPLGLFGQAGNVGRVRWHLGTVRAQIRQGTLAHVAVWVRQKTLVMVVGSGKEHWPGGIAVGVWQGPLALWGCGWGGNACSMHVSHHSWHFRFFFLAHGAAVKVPAWTQTGKQYRLEEASLASRFFFRRDTLLPLIFCFDMLSSERFWYSGETLDDSLNSSANTRCLEVGWLAV